ncbi:hypothetical protein AC244_02075 [Ensifer adhaerens]|uniref:Uncharacterized protein n=1 Tax=Ensifer adhaerens TaxID=106592 RepID=A0A0L8C621_ENSAD|nr:hypothetical protein [Ensifer adhaerens]KOF22351.1 hypothetical protein AC244_02075 [Ensifer adhaerens]
MSKHELINTGTDKHYVRRDKEGQFKESVDVGRSLSADKRQKAKTVAKPGEATRATSSALIDFCPLIARWRGWPTASGSKRDLFSFSDALTYARSAEPKLRAWIIPLGSDR